MVDLILPLAIVPIAAEIGAAVAHVARLPRVVGQIGAGLLMSPSLVGVVADGAPLPAPSAARGPGGGRGAQPGDDIAAFKRSGG